MVETDNKLQNMTAIDNELLEQFFQPARRMQVEDNGFSERVMRLLPDRALRLSRWWTVFCLMLGLVLFVVFKGWQPLLISMVSLTRNLTDNVHPIPFFMTLGVLSCLAVLELVQRMEQMQEV